MKPLSQQNHYETLEIPADASPKVIERAYQLARSTYADGSLAGHSVFDPGDVEFMRERIEIAFRTLSDPETRRGYDDQLRELGVAEPETTAASGSDPITVATSVAPPTETVEPPMPFDADEFDDDEGDFDGARLRRSRMRHGIELEQIASVTKVNPTYLRFIEEERFADLPAAVYVRGFVMGYASCVGLDPKRVAASYMQRVEADGGESRRGLFKRRG